MREIYFNEEQLNQMYCLYYKKHVSLYNIAKMFNTNYNVIWKRFVKLGWDRRDPYDAHQKYFCNEHLFDKIDTADKAYCLGLWYADGCNHLDDGDITIELQSRDVDVLKAMNIFMKNNNPLLFQEALKHKTRKQNTYILRAHSHYLCERLNELGFIPKKSLTLDFPYWMNMELIPFMLRGYIDGDGWIQKSRIGFMSTDKFCNGVKQYLNSIGLDCSIYDMKRHYDKHTKTVNIFGKKNNVPLATKMFADGSIFMQRKLDKYLEFGFLTKETNNLISA